MKVISLPYIFQILYVLCFTRPRYQVNVYRTIGPPFTGPLGLLQDNMDKKCFLGVNFSTSTNHLLYNTML